MNSTVLVDGLSANLFSAVEAIGDNMGSIGVALGAISLLGAGYLAVDAPLRAYVYYSAIADVNATDKRGRTALHRASFEGDERRVAALLASGADVNATDKRGRTALYMAADRGYKSIVETLVAAGADRRRTEIPLACLDREGEIFYRRSDYREVTMRELAGDPLNLSARFDVLLPEESVAVTQYKVIKFAKLIFYYITLPVAIPCYCAFVSLHFFTGIVGVFLSSMKPKHEVDRIRLETSLDGEWKYKRVAIRVDGIVVDAMLMGRESTLENGRWVLDSGGNAEVYEYKLLPDSNFPQILTELNSNAIIFNYPGVGASSGVPSRKATDKAYRAMLTFLESNIQAKEIIGYGHSIGGAVQGDALEKHTLKEGVKYVFIKSRTFSNYATIVSHVTNRVFGLWMRIIGWNMDSVNSSKKLQAPEIILQSAGIENDYERLTDSARVVDDGIITPGASLAKALLDDPTCPKENKVFIGMRGMHNDPIDARFLADQVEALL